MRSLDGHGQLVFRVYHPAGGGFTDYDIDHTDLQVKITDEDAYFYGGKILDHAPETLGLEECDHEPDHNGECLKCDEPVWLDEEVKYHGEFFETTTGHIMGTVNEKSSKAVTFNKKSEKKIKNSLDDIDYVDTFYGEEDTKEILWLDPISPSEHGVTEEMMKSTPQLEWFFRDYQRWIERYNIK